MRPKVLSGTAAAAFVLTLAACSADSGAAAQTPSVASLAQKSASEPSATTERPRERLDTTPEEYEQLLQPYYDCMDEKGVDAAGFKEKMSRLDPNSQAGETEKFEKAEALCNKAFWPLPAWEKDPANPDAREFAQAVVACLKEKGVRYVEVDADGVSMSLGGTDNHMPSITKGMELTPECEREVAAQGS